MQNKSIHIFVVSNPISCIHASVLMKQLKSDDNDFILLLDQGKRKNSFTNEIINCAGKNWNQIIDFGESISDNSNLKPSLRKRITRKIKTIWPVKPLYNSLLKKYVTRYNEETTRKLNEKLQFIDTTATETKLYLLTQTLLNRALIDKFPKATINFFEHGLPDYLFAFKQYSFSPNTFYCLFNNEFSAFVERERMKGPAVKQLMSKEQYLDYCGQLFKDNIVINHLNKKISNPSVLVIMQSLEKYELGNEFWLIYLEKIYIREKEISGNCNLVLKPHPHQSNEVLHSLSQQLTNKGINNIILNEPNEIGFSSEVLFSTLFQKFTAVYSPFSYSVYFLSHLFMTDTIRFYDSYETMKKHIGKAPKQYQVQFLEHEKIIKECFSIQTKAFTF